MLPNFPKQFRFKNDSKSITSNLTEALKNGQPFSQSDWEGYIARQMDRDRDLEDYLTHLGSSTSTGGGNGTEFYYSVGTPGIVAFGNVGATPPAMFAAADFQTDGATDDVGIQAAIDAAATYRASNSIYPKVLLLPGIYVLGASLDTKGIDLVGSGRRSTVLYALSGVTPANTRIIDNVSGSPMTIEHLQMIQTTVAATIYAAQIERIFDCAFVGSDVGTDNAVVFTTVGNGQFIQNTMSSGPGSDKGGLHIQDGFMIVSDNLFQSANIVLEAATECVIHNNRLEGDSGFLGFPFNGIKLITTSFNNIITGNYVTLYAQDGILIDHCQDNEVQGNLVYDVGKTAANTYDGIKLQNTANTNNVQNNTVRQNASSHKYGIEVNGAGCTANLVTNNDVKNGYTTGGIQDTGTGTIVVAGNRV